MAPTIMHTLSPEDLANLIRSAVKVELQALQVLKTEEDKRLLTRKEVAERFNVSKETISNWCREKKLPFTQTGNRLCFRSADIEAYLAKGVKYTRNSH